MSPPPPLSALRVQVSPYLEGRGSPRESPWVSLGSQNSYLKGGGEFSKLAISRVIIRVTPFRALITLLITYLLSPLPLQVHFEVP